MGVEKLDGQINRVLRCANSDELKGQFGRNTRRNFNDIHLWFSVLNLPPYSTFTRAERVTCCFLILYLSMLVSIMYYSSTIDNKQQDDPMIIYGPSLPTTTKTVPVTSGIQLGPFTLTIEQVIYIIVIQTTKIN